MPNHTKNNLKLIKKLEDLVAKHPEQRFSQLLFNYKFVKEVRDDEGLLFWKDEFYIEPEELLKRCTLDPS